MNWKDADNAYDQWKDAELTGDLPDYNPLPAALPRKPLSLRAMLNDRLYELRWKVDPESRETAKVLEGILARTHVPFQFAASRSHHDAKLTARGDARNG